MNQLAYTLLIAALAGTVAATDSAGIARKRSSLPYKSNNDFRERRNEEDDPFLGMLEDLLVEKSMSLSMPMETATPDMYAYLTYYSDFISCSDLVVTMPIISGKEILFHYENLLSHSFSISCSRIILSTSFILFLPFRR